MPAVSLADARRALAVATDGTVTVTALDAGVVATSDGWWRVEPVEAELQPTGATIVGVRPDIRVHPPTPPIGVVLAATSWKLDEAGVQRAWHELGADSGIAWGAFLALRYWAGVLPRQVVRDAADPLVGSLVADDDPVPPEGDASTRRLLAWRSDAAPYVPHELVTFVVAATGELTIEVEAVREVR